MTDKQIIDGECLRCGAKTKKHILVCEKCTEEMGTVIAHKFTIDKQTREIKQLKKQLKRKEQECEELKEEVSFLKESNLKLQPIEDARSLEKCYLQQLDQLKGVIKKYEECNKYLVEENGKTYTRLEYKLLKTLAEIKEIAEDFGFNGTYESYKTAIDQILQKINEVEDENM